MLSVHGVHHVKHMDIHTAEPLVTEPSLIEVENCYWRIENV